MSEPLEAFVKALDGEWVVERYSVDADGRLRVHYRSETGMEWSHTPFNALSDTPRIGATGRIGFIAREQVDLIRSRGGEP